MKKLLFICLMAVLTVACGGKFHTFKADSSASTNAKTDKKAKTETKTEEPKKEEKPSTAKLMEGEWNLISFAGKEIAKEKTNTFTFKADGTGTIVAGNKTTQMKWEVKQKDGKDFLATKTEIDEEFEIKSIDAKKVVIIDIAGDVEMHKK